MSSTSAALRQSTGGTFILQGVLLDLAGPLSLAVLLLPKLEQTQDWMNEIYPMLVAAHGIIGLCDGLRYPEIARIVYETMEEARKLSDRVSQDSL